VNKMTFNVTFKSTPENFRKEYFGLKRNTIRKFTQQGINEPTEDIIRRDYLDRFISGEITDMTITLLDKHPHNQEFTRQITDVTLWEGIYIISW
jgi:hypothetical protein